MSYRNPPSPEPSDTSSAKEAELFASKDVLRLIQLIGRSAAQRSDPRAWRNELLTGLNQLLPAAGSCALVLQQTAMGTAPVIVSMFDAGFQGEAQRKAFRTQYNLAPFRDLFSRRALERFIAGKGETFTVARSDLVDDASWYADPQVKAMRQSVGIDDCLLSLYGGTSRGMMHVLCAYRRADAILHPVPQATAHDAPLRFRVRERALLDILHQGMRPLYVADETAQHMNRAVDLPPRLRQTLECLLAGDTERRAAAKMGLSIHTVHGYVKTLYVHFGVSRRAELLAKWMNTTGPFLPETK